MLPNLGKLLLTKTRPAILLAQSIWPLGFISISPHHSVVSCLGMKTSTLRLPFITITTTIGISAIVVVVDVGLILSILFDTLTGVLIKMLSNIFVKSKAMITKQYDVSLHKN